MNDKVHTVQLEGGFAFFWRKTAMDHMLKGQMHKKIALEIIRVGGVDSV